MTPGLARAIERVKADSPPPLTPEQHPQVFVGLGELLDEREQQGKAADPAA